MVVLLPFIAVNKFAFNNLTFRLFTALSATPTQTGKLYRKRDSFLSRSTYLKLFNSWTQSGSRTVDFLDISRLFVAPCHFPSGTICAEKADSLGYINGRLYSLSHINWCRLCIRVSAKKSRGKNLIGALEVSYRPTDTKFFPLSAKQKAD